MSKSSTNPYSEGMDTYSSARSSLSSSRTRVEEVDWKGLEEKFGELKSYLSAPTLSFSNSAEERKRQQENIELGLEAIIEVALSESSMLYQEREFKQAFIASLRTLKFVQELYGTNSMEQIEIYFLLAKITQSLKRYKESDEFLSFAQWTIVKNKNTTKTVLAELHQNYGLLYVQKGDIKKAIEHLATSVYFLSIIHGTNNLVTSFGYFNLGNVFASQGNIDSSIQYFQKVADIWGNELEIAINNDILIHNNPNEKDGENNNIKTDLLKIEEEKIIEAGRMLEQVLNVIIDKFTENSLETGKIFKVLGLYQFFIGENVKSKECLEKAESVMKYVLGDNHKEIKKIEKFLKKINENFEEDIDEEEEEEEEEL